MQWYPVTTTAAINRQVQLAFGFAIVALLVVGAFSYYSIGVFRDSARWVQHTHTVLERLQDLQFAFKSVESSSREFVLTGEESYLQSYRASLASARQYEEAVRRLTVDNPKQQRELQVLEALVTQRIQFAELVVSL